jgi:low affinity Fe/Cu permease
MLTRADTRLGKTCRYFGVVLKLILLDLTRILAGFSEERQMKMAISIAVAVVLPFGLFVLGGVILSRMLAKLRQERADEIERPRASTQG